jgi:chemotaxis regulatin CheY-phosphate phosphatase CheZ
MSRETCNTVMPKTNFNKFSNYKNIYSDLIENVDEVLSDISQINVEHVEIKEKNNEVQTKLNGIRNEFVSDIDKLEKNVIWDRFTIAFFGETNAGKSTIIESLRISMLEDEKLKSLNLKKSLDREISILNKKTEDAISSIIEFKERQTRDITSQLESIKERAKLLGTAFWANWFNVFRSWFGLLPILFYAKKIKLLSSNLIKIEAIVPEEDKNVLELLKEIEKKNHYREELFDGKIIGTGIPDFTQSCVEYYFNQEEKPFTLIDVPGIEGKEEEYETIIMDAVTKAHCIFYVCSTSKLPESGTVAKIKKYLKEQTEVYFLLNERKKPSSFDEVLTFEAVCPNNEKFRKDLANQMQNELGEFYKGCYSLQGLLAFFSVGFINPNEIEQEQNYKLQNKLLDRFEARDELYSFSQLENVENLIRSQFNGMERKIIDANLQKGICATIDFKNHIAEIRNTIYSNDFIQNIENEIKVLDKKNNNEFRQFENELNQLSNKLSSSAVRDLRVKLYHLVDNKENNAQLNVADSKSLLSPFYSDQEKKIKFIAKCYNSYVFDELSQNFTNSVEKKVDTFRKNIKENINKMQNNIEQITLAKLSTDFENHTIGDLNILISIDWVKLGNVAMSVGGMAMTGAGIGTTVFPGIGSALGAAIGAALGLLFVGIRWLIDKETPEAKAKKQIDEKFSNTKNEIKTKLDSINKSIIDDYKKNVIDKVRIMLDDNINGIKAIQSILDSKTNQLEELIKEIKTNKN